MKTEHFKKLSISDDWWQHLISYPNGFTIYENLIDWVSRTNAVIKNVNEWNEYLDDFVENFDEKLKPTVIETLYKMEEDGTLATIINETIFNDLNNKIDDNSAAIDQHSLLFKDTNLNPTQFPYMADRTGAIDNTDVFNTIINTDGYRYLNLPSGTFILDTLTIPSGVIIKGAGKGKTIIKKKEAGTSNPLFLGVNTDGFILQDLTIQHQTTPNNVCSLIELDGQSQTTPVRNIMLDNVEFIDTKNGLTDIIKIKRFAENIRIVNCDFKATSNNNTTYSSACIKFDNMGEFLDNENSPVWIDNNHFDGGKEGVTFIGAGSPMSPISVTNNHFINQTRKGLQIYHGERHSVIGNRFENITAESGFNNDSGVIWLDELSYEDDQRNIVADNVIHDCYGNGLFLEEYRGLIINNEIRRMKERRNDVYSVNYVYTTPDETVEAIVHSMGGNGILVSGGCHDLTIQGNRITECEKSAIMFNRAIGVHTGVDIRNVFVINNHLEINRHTIMLMERVLDVIIKGNVIKSDLENQSAYGVHINRVNTHTNNIVRNIIVEDNHFYGFNAVQKRYTTGTVVMVGNKMYLVGSVSDVPEDDLVTVDNYKFNYSDKSFITKI